MQTDQVKKLFVNKYSAIGEEKFYQFLITFGFNKIVENAKNNPAIELIEYYDLFLKLYRRENKKIHLELAKQFRKAAHKIYRVMLKKNLMKTDKRFLNGVS